MIMYVKNYNLGSRKKRKATKTAQINKQKIIIMIIIIITTTTTTIKLNRILEQYLGQP